MKYTASKTRSGRPGWSVTFKHPKRSDSRGRPGLKIRRGLKTQDDEQADRIVADINLLLSDESWWSLDRRKEAEIRFHPIAVGAFFDGMEAGKLNSWERREQHVPLPGRDEGYSRVMLAGTTGAGKTTLLRHIIGCGHRADRFPSTSTARTTTADFEIITEDCSLFEAVVTFMPEHEVRAHIDECLEEACLRAIQGDDDARIISALLSHHEQRFRLSYVLGGWTQKETEERDTDFEFEDGNAETDDIDPSEVTTSEEIRRNRALLESFLSRIRAVARQVGDIVSRELGDLSALDNTEDKACWLELFADTLYENEDFVQLTLDILDEVESRFSSIEDGDFHRSSTGWPELWAFSTDDRSSFLKQIRWFSSNHHQQFGRLLTPLVDGVRVKGPFFPSLEELRVAPRLVLLDGEGIGHAAKSATSVSTRVTRRFAQADLILLVDNAEQPMQAAPLELLRSIGTSGNSSKLAVAFTHFDLVKGANLGNHELKCEHVLNSVRNGLASLKQTVGAAVATMLEKRIESAAYFLGGLDREIQNVPRGFRNQLQGLIQLMQDSGAPAEPLDLSPIYSGEGLELALRDAIEGFQRPWRARLGLAYHDGISKEHWTRVKALSRRFAMAWSNEYNNMRPVADLIARLQENISQWLENPTAWNRQPKDEQEQDLALSLIRQTVFAAVHDLAEERLSELHRTDWSRAYDYAGRGSTVDRAHEIEEIYSDAAPIFSSAMSPDARAFLHLLSELVGKAIKDAGGTYRQVGS